MWCSEEAALLKPSRLGSAGGCASWGPKPSWRAIIQDMHHFRSVSMYFSALVQRASCSRAQHRHSQPGTRMHNRVPYSRVAHLQADNRCHQISSFFQDIRLAVTPILKTFV